MIILERAVVNGEIVPVRDTIFYNKPRIIKRMSRRPKFALPSSWYDPCSSPNSSVSALV